MDTLTIIIAGGIVLIAIVVAFIFANRKNWRILKSSPVVEDSEESESSTAVDHYTEMRDDLTLEDAGVDKEKEEEVEETSSGGFSILTRVISLAMVAIVFSVLMPTLKSAMNTMNTTGTNMGGFSSGMTQSLFSWLPIVMIVGFVFVIITAFGFGGSSSSSTTTKKKVRKKGVKHYTAMRDQLSKK